MQKQIRIQAGIKNAVVLRIGRLNASSLAALKFFTMALIPVMPK